MCIRFAANKSNQVEYWAALPPNERVRIHACVWARASACARSARRPLREAGGAVAVAPLRGDVCATSRGDALGDALSRSLSAWAERLSLESCTLTLPLSTDGIRRVWRAHTYMGMHCALWPWLECSLDIPRHGTRDPGRAPRCQLGRGLRIPVRLRQARNELLLEPCIGP